MPPTWVGSDPRCGCRLDIGLTPAQVNALIRAMDDNNNNRIDFEAQPHPELPQHETTCRCCRNGCRPCARAPSPPGMKAPIPSALPVPDSAMATRSARTSP